MKIYQKLAVTTAGVAVLASVGTAPAVAAEFILNGKLGYSNEFIKGQPPSVVDNGSFDGTYSYSGPPQSLENPVVTINNLNINLRNAAGKIYETFNSTNSSGGIFPIIPSGNEIEASILTFGSNTTSDSLTLTFGGIFTGVGSAEGSASNREVAIVQQVTVPIDSATSEAVPEPLNIVGSGIALGFIILMQKSLLSPKIKSRKNKLTIQS